MRSNMFRITVSILSLEEMISHIAEKKCTRAKIIYAVSLPHNTLNSQFGVS